MKSPLFYSKILLFGEYGIIKDSKGLAIPYSSYNGSFKIMSEPPTKEQMASNEGLKKYAIFLEGIDVRIAEFDLIQLHTDLQNGLYFDSTIPQGYGVGSSGALVAAIYERYALEKISPEQAITHKKLLRLKEIFGQMESFFHGKSSGLDPLSSYLSLPILINSQTNMQTISVPSSQEGGAGAVFLLDSGVVGETAPMVQIFMESMKNEGFRAMLKNQFSAYTDSCIEHFLSGNFKALTANMRELSQLVLQHFKPMIPQQFHQLWKQGIDSGDYFLKLCGSGGGGYILGVCADFEKAQKALQGHKLEVVYRF